MTYPKELTEGVRQHPYPLVFATVSGAHLYGFPSPDSDWDLRGVHLLPLREVLGFKSQRDTVEYVADPTRDSGIELDLVTHDALKFAGLLLKRNGYVLEQLTSPLVIHTTPAHNELLSFVSGVITRHHAHHYLGFTQNQWQLLVKEPQPRVKPLLYAFRTVLTGIHLMNTGQIEASLQVLNEEARLPYLTDLMALKREGCEKEPLPGPLDFYAVEHRRLTTALEHARDVSSLPEAVPEDVKEGINDWVIRQRLEHG